MSEKQIFSIYEYLASAAKKKIIIIIIHTCTARNIDAVTAKKMTANMSSSVTMASTPAERATTKR